MGRGGSENEVVVKKGRKDESGDGDGTVGLQANMSLFSAVMLGVNCIIGSGIFVSTKGVHANAGSVGLSLMVWLLCGVFSAFGAYCYAELGTFITKAGGDYAYVYVAFGKFVGFVRLWIECIIIRPCTLAAVALIFATYVLNPFFPTCPSPFLTPQLLAAGCLILLALVNAFSAKLTESISNFCSIGKLSALCLIIATGFMLIIRKPADQLEAFSDMFDGSSTDFGKISIAFYSGLWSFNGWNYLNIVAGELKNPKRNLPISIGLSCLICTVVYTLANVAFYAGVTLDEVVESSAVAVTFAEHNFPSWVAALMPICVALSCFGTVNGVLMTSSRLFYAGALEDQMPTLLCMVNPYYGTPMPSVFFILLLSLGYLTMSDNIYSLINSVQIVNWIAVAIAVLGLIYLRYSMPDDQFPRPVKVSLVFPVVFLLGCVFLIVFPLYQEPKDSLIGIGLLLTSLPVYWIFFVWKSRPAAFNSGMDAFTLVCQKLMLVVAEKKGS